MFSILQSLRPVLSGDAEVRACEIESTGSKLEAYLYEQRRCAIAHANDPADYSPDDAAQIRGIVTDLRLVAQLSELTIENHLGVPSMTEMIRRNRASPHIHPAKGWVTVNSIPRRRAIGTIAEVQSQIVARWYRFVAGAKIKLGKRTK